MTPRGAPLSENEKIYCVCILFPIFWPLIPVLLLVQFFTWAGDRVRSLYWRWKDRNEPEDHE